MKRLFLLFALLSIIFSAKTRADEKLNLTPVPKQITMGTGKVTIPQEELIIYTGNLDKDIAQEANAFGAKMLKFGIKEVNILSELGNVTPFITLEAYSGTQKIGNEGYTLDITTDGVKITANAAQGFYFAFQTIKKLLPPCVMADVVDENVTTLELPCLKIVDSPRFEYRGFMLDVARHYFEVAEIKRMIDVMSYYKMNRFHWHLVDDQGWRIEIEKYPKLTSIGSVRNNSWSVDPVYGGYYINEPYGPYFYTKEEIRDIVAYAKERHIEVIPEVEFPGHACAALAAYPEFSCYPNGSHSVKVDGGIYSDVFNVGSPATLQFAKDILDEIIELFPFNQIHIGGDECPTSAWENNAECLALKQEEGYSHIRELQSRFVRLLADYLREKGKEAIMWNESLSANGTNVDLIDGTEGIMMCWENGKVQSTALQAAQLGMRSVITPWGPYYINRKQSTDPSEPTGAGYGNDDLRATYSYVPVPTSVPQNLQKYYIGIQGTFWTEHVQSNYLLEYLALPRLIAIAETGWSPESKKNFDDFCRRVTADSVLLNYNNYEYGRHFMKNGAENKVMPQTSTVEDWNWYHIVTGATDAARAGKCIELLREGAPQIGTGNAKANRLWNGTIAQEGDAAYDYQLWALMEDPANPGKYALVNKAKPDGSVNSTPTASNNTARWDYDNSKRHYDFILGEAVYNKNGNYYRYSIRSQKAAAGMYMNFAGAGQNNSINMWSDPNDGNGGVWEFQPIESHEEDIQIDYPAQGSYVRIDNNVPAYAGWRIMDEGGASATARATDYAADVWEIVSATTAADGQTVTLRNLATGRYISSTAAPLALGASAVELKNIYNQRTGDFTISANGKAIFPMPERSTANPNTIGTGGIYPQGSAWVYTPVYQITYECYDSNGSHIGTYYQSAEQGAPYQCTAPAIKNMTVTGYDGAEQAPAYDALDGHKSIRVTYERGAYSVTIMHQTQEGGIILSQEYSCPIGSEFTPQWDESPAYFTLLPDSEVAPFIPTEDTVITLTYTTDALIGWAKAGKAVESVEAGKSYILFNNKNESARNGFLYANKIGENIMTDNSASSGGPAYVWYTQENGSYMKVSNGLGCYIPTLTKGSANNASQTGGSFRFTSNGDGTFSVRDAANSLYWNGNDNHTFTGWTDGHPFIVYEYYVKPYFNVIIRCIDSEGNTLQSSSSIKEADDSFVLMLPQIEGYTFAGISGGVIGSNKVEGHLEIVLTFNSTTAIEAVESDTVESNQMYDLMGRKVVNPTKGIYIINGKKQLIK
ncbi:MAG: beta-N-acetylhexosaminidase [Bacteroidaceae bacterium]|nr:beta-N-acetylhexosaminidase [Bacteroidaceae bacterium]